MSVIEDYYDQQVPEWRHDYVRLHDHERLVDCIRSLVHSDAFNTDFTVSMGSFDPSARQQNDLDECSLLRKYDRLFLPNYDTTPPDSTMSADVSAGINQFSRLNNATFPDVPPTMYRGHSLHAIVLPAAQSSPSMNRSTRVNARYPDSLQLLEAAYADIFIEDAKLLQKRYYDTITQVKDQLGDLQYECDVYQGITDYGSLGEDEASLRQSFLSLDLPDVSLQIGQNRHIPSPRRSLQHARQEKQSQTELMNRISLLHVILTKLRVFVDGCNDALEQSLSEHDAASPIKQTNNLSGSFDIPLRWSADALTCQTVLASKISGNSQRTASAVLRGQYNPLRPSAEWTSVALLSGLCFCVAVLMFTMHLLIPDILSNVFITASMPLFRLIIVTVVYIAGWAGVVHVCRLLGINYSTQLNLDVRVLLLPVELWRLAVSILFVATLTAFISSCVYVYEWIRSVTPSETEISGNTALLGVGMEGATIHAWVFVVTLMLLCYPGKRFFHHTRFYLFRQLKQILLAPWSPIHFSHTFIGDQQCSLTKTLFDIVYAQCFYFSGEFLATSSLIFKSIPSVLFDHHTETHITSTCRPFVKHFQWVLAFLPFTLRAIQCICLYKREGKQKHLWNQGKYSMAIAMTLCAMLYKQQLDVYTSLQKSIFPQGAKDEEGDHVPNPFLKKMSSSLFGMLGGPHASQTLETAYNHMEQAHEDASASSLDNSIVVHGPGSVLQTALFSNLQLSEQRMQAAVVDQFWSIFLVLALSTTQYNLAWDLIMDWGLFERGPAFPFRKHSTIPSSKRTLVFTSVICLNILQRCTWVDTLLPTSMGVSVFKSDMSILFLSIQEVSRRSLWNIIRLDLEQVEKQVQLPKVVYEE